MSNLPALRPVTRVHPELRKIGIRYTPRHIVRRDDSTGVFEELNAPLDSFSERAIQAALLRPPRKGLVARLTDWLRSLHNKESSS